MASCRLNTGPPLLCMLAIRNTSSLKQLSRPSRKASDSGQKIILKNVSRGQQKHEKFQACKELVFDCFIDTVILIVLLELSGLLLCLQQSSRIEVYPYIDPDN